MILYHGSTVEVVSPDIMHSRKNLDFGQGFYLTSFKEQAKRWALRKAFLEDAPAIVNEYEFSDNLTSFNVLQFREADESWVEFVCACRRGETGFQNYDVIIGGVANDKVYEAVNMYFKGYWDMPTTLNALRHYENNDQYCFVSQKAIDELLRFRASCEVPQ